MKITFNNERNLFKNFKRNKKKNILLLLTCFFAYINFYVKIKNIKDIKVALCTMGKMENLYVKEFVDYYFNLGIDHIFIYDDNDPKSEKISNALDNRHKKFTTIYETRLFHIKNQSMAFNNCYKRSIDKFDWFLMVDMDEFLFIVNNTLKGYLTNKIFNKCDFIKFHWVITTDNNLIYYDKRPLFERFKPPYIKKQFIKSIVRGNITDLKYWVHSPFFSPKRNITCNNAGKRIYYKNMNFETLYPINTEKAYIIHFRYKSTEELINKLKRGYSNWFKNKLRKFIIGNIETYLKINKPTLEKINFIEKELKINLSRYKKKKIYSKKF